MEHTNEVLNHWLEQRYSSEKGPTENTIFNEAAQLKNKENEYQLLMVWQAFGIWKFGERKREKWRARLLYGFGVLSIIQTMFIMAMVVLNALYNKIYISEGVFISVIFGTLVQIISVIMIITKSVFNNKDDKTLEFISRWIKRA
ncbi:MAG: hypothetical protein FWE08_02475 [Oscillospiraceae bacterium]|nr:hypothetical protein [Oscillospiraceae bacterium]